MSRAPRINGPAPVRFWAKVDKTGDCWIWTAATDALGYGRFGVSPGRTAFAHRWAYEAEVGPLNGLTVDHLCRNPSCVRPDHLEAVELGENTRRGLRSFALTGRCRSGLHDVTDPANIYTRPNGRRRCRRCHGRVVRAS